MPQPRRTSLWRFLGVLTCLGMLTVTSILLWGDKSARENRQQVAHSPHLPPPPVADSVVAKIPETPQELRDDDLLFPENSLSGELQQRCGQPLETAEKAAAIELPGNAEAADAAGI